MIDLQGAQDLKEELLLMLYFLTDIDVEITSLNKHISSSVYCYRLFILHESAFHVALVGFF